MKLAKTGVLAKNGTSTLYEAFNFKTIDPSSYKEKAVTKDRNIQWKWGGCSHNVKYGMDFSKQFLDSLEKAGDIQSTVNLHNNRAGRLVSKLYNILSGFCAF